MAHLYAHADGNDAAGFWYTAPTGGSQQNPVNGDTLDTNGYTVNAANYFIGVYGNTFTLVDGVGTGKVLFSSGVMNMSSITIQSGGTLRLNNTFNIGTLICGANGTIILYGTPASMPITCKADGIVTFIQYAAFNGAPLVCEANGTVTFQDRARNEHIIRNAGLLEFNGADNNCVLVCEPNGTISFQNAAINKGLTICRKDGTVTLVGSTNSGKVECEKDGDVTLTTSNNTGEIVCEFGGNITYQSGTNAGRVKCECGGNVSVKSSATFQGINSCESGGTFSFETYTGGYPIYCYSGATVTNHDTIDLGEEKRTTHYTGDITGTIQIRNDTNKLHNSDIIVAAENVKKGVPRWEGATGDDIGTLEVEGGGGAVVYLPRIIGA